MQTSGAAHSKYPAGAFLIVIPAVAVKRSLLMEKAFALWSAPRKSKVEERTGGRWETPEKELPAFELPDMNGRTWRLKDLAGKAVLINVRATWCGACRAELPLLQKL